jgi:hypothetical protein
MYVMTNQNGPCFVRDNRQAEVQTQMFVEKVIACWSRVFTSELVLMLHVFPKCLNDTCIFGTFGVA